MCKHESYRRLASFLKAGLQYPKKLQPSENVLFNYRKIFNQQVFPFPCSFIAWFSVTFYSNLDNWLVCGDQYSFPETDILPENGVFNAFNFHRKLLYCSIFIGHACEHTL